MPEALTESFCERCGTRYEFEAPAELNPLRKTRGLISGLKNYILSQDALGDAIGDAMRTEEQQIASRQLEAFHSAFNFCIDCRQYACTNCWNDAAGRCRSCAPIAGKDDLGDRLEAAYLADHAAMHAGEAQLGVDEISRRLGVETWPRTDLPEQVANGHAAPEWPAAEAVGAAPEAAVDALPEAEVAETVEAQPVEAAGQLPPDAEEEIPAPTRVLAWESDTEITLQGPIEEALPELAAEWVAEPMPEPEPVAAEAEPEPMPEPEPVAAEVEEEWVAEPMPEPEPVAAEVEPEPEPMPEPVAAEVEPEPEPVAAEAEAEPTQEPESVAPRPIRPIAETILRVPPRVAKPQEPIDEEAVAARRAQLDLLGLDDPGVGGVAPEPPRVLPYRSRGAAARPSELVQRTLGPSNALWDASAREVAAARSAVAVQSCGSCGLSLSASARFCRRCGTQQARSA